jgi:hypothetical protein
MSWQRHRLLSLPQLRLQHRLLPNQLVRSWKLYVQGYGEAFWLLSCYFALLYENKLLKARGIQVFMRLWVRCMDQLLCHLFIPYDRVNLTKYNNP